MTFPNEWKVIKMFQTTNQLQWIGWRENRKPTDLNYYFKKMGVSEVSSIFFGLKISLHDSWLMLWTLHLFGKNLGSPQRPFQEPNLVPTMKLDLWGRNFGGSSGPQFLETFTVDTVGLKLNDHMSSYVHFPRIVNKGTTEFRWEITF